MITRENYVSDWQKPTTVLERFGDVMELLCQGHRPSDELLQAYLMDTDQDSLLEFALEHGPAWAQGAALIDAALLMVDAPTEIISIDSRVDHEHRF